MAKFGKKYTPSPEAKRYAEQIRIAWRSTLQGILQVAKLLNEAQAELGRKRWLEMVDNDLPFERRMAEKLVKLAGDTRINDPKYVDSLPPRWTTLHELTYLADDQFEAGVKSGTIHAGMERSDAEALRVPQKRQTKRRAADGSASLQGTRPAAASAGAGSNGHVRDSASTTADPRPNGQSPTSGQFAPNNGRFGPTQNSDQATAAEPGQASQIATLAADRALSAEEATHLENELNILCETYGLKLEFLGYPSEEAAKDGRRENLAREMNRWIDAHTSCLRHKNGMTVEDVQLVEDAIAQMETKKYPRKNKDGTYQKQDIRNPAHPFHDWKDDDGGWDVERIYDHCENNMIVTQYTPLSHISYVAYLKLLTYAHCKADRERQRTIEDELHWLAKKEEHIAEQNEVVDEKIAAGANLKDVFDLIPWVNSTFRSPMIDKFCDIEPGHANAALERLVR